MNKKWMASTALASVLAAIGVSSNTSHVRAAITANDKSNDSDSDVTATKESKDTSVASVMDEQGAPVTNSDDISNTNTNDSLSSSLLRSSDAITQAVSRTGATVSQQQAFINLAVPMAQRAANKYNLYTSVMLAQAIVESAWGQSDLTTEANNLFGVKGDYNGAYISMPTHEWSAEKGWYVIYANFARYASYYESFADNGNKLRNGPTWDSSYYKGTWKENTSSYKDATAWLQGRYATGPEYAQTLNSIIATYNLTQYDDSSNTNNNSGSGSTEQPVNGTQTKIDDVAVVTNKNNAFVYTDAYPDQMSNRALSFDTAWKVISKVVTPDGEVYYQVSTHEYVKASDVKLQSEQQQTTTQPPVPISDVITVANTDGAKVYSDADTSKTTDRTLPYQSSWVTTSYVLDNDNNKFYFVGTDAYVSANDVQLASESNSDDYTKDTVDDYPDVVHITASPSARLYNSKHQMSSNRALASNTDWKIDKKSVHSDGSVWYRVSSDEWVSANDVQVKGSNYVKSVSGSVKINYIPGYGVNVYNSPAKNHKYTGTRLADGTTWNVTSKQIVDGTTWYELNSGWVDGKYCIYTEK